MSQDSGSENSEEEEPSASEGEDTGLLLEPVEEDTGLLLEPEIEQQEGDTGEEALVGVQGPVPGQKAGGADLDYH